MDRKCKNCFMPLGTTQIECGNCGAQNPLEKAVVAGGDEPMEYVPSPDMYPMKWFKFLIYFSLFAGAVLNVLSGLMTLSGAQYGGEASYFYEIRPELQMINMLHGIALIALGVFALVTRFALAGYRKAGPVMYYAMLACTILVALAYGVMASGIAPVTITSGNLVYTYTFANWPSILGNCIGTTIVLICNIIYFNKRKQLFVY